MAETIEQARAILESEGWKFTLDIDDDHPVWPVRLTAYNAELGITSTARHTSESEAWALLLSDGGP